MEYTNIASAGSKTGPAPQKPQRSRTLEMFLSLVAILVPTASLPPAALAVQAASPAVRAARSQVVTLRGYDRNGRGTEQGSGFYLSGGRIATNSHVVAGAYRVDIFDVKGHRLGTAHFAEALSTRMDLAILPAPSTRFAGLPLGDSVPEIGDLVWVYGSPKGLAGTMSTGIVSALRVRNGRAAVQISAPVSRGSSGGPVLNGRGEVIGVTVATIPDGQNLNFAVPVGDLRRLAQSGVGRVAFPDARNSERTVAGHDEDDDRDARGEGSWDAQGPDWYRLTRELRPGRRLEGEIAASDYTYDGQPYDMFWFDGTSGQRVEIDVSSEIIDPYLVVTNIQDIGNDDPWTLVDDDGGGGKNAMLVAELPADGAYMILVSSYEKTPGRYVIAMSDGSGSDPGHDPARTLPKRWEFIARNSSDADLYYDRESMSERNGNLSVWIYTLYPESQTDGATTYDASKALFEFRCRAAEFRLNQYLLLRGERVMGSEGFVADGRWSAVSPDSVAEDLLSSICDSSGPADDSNPADDPTSADDSTPTPHEPTG